MLFLAPILRTGWLVGWVALAGCGDDDVMGTDAGHDGSVAGSLIAHFAPEADPMPFGATPFPDDLYLDDAGRVALGTYPNEENAGLAPEYPVALREGFAELDGFGLLSPVFFPVEGEVDPGSLPSGDATLTETASAFLMDVDPASPSAFERIPAQVAWVPRHGLVAVRPQDGHPLAAGRRYAAVLTTGVQATDGSALAPAPTFLAVRGDAVPEEPLLAEAHARYAPVLSGLASRGVPRAEVAALAVFTTQSVTDDLELARAQTWAEPAPAVTIDEVLSGEALDARLGVPTEDEPGLGAEGGVAHEGIGYMVHGSFEANWYLSDTAHVHGVFRRDDEGALVVPRKERVPFTLLLPATAASEPPRVVLFQHGITAQRGDVLGIANVLVGAGYALLAIDAPWHGLRARGGVDDRNRYTGAMEPDGFGDASGSTIVVDFAGIMDFNGPLIEFHPAYFRDAMRQSAADLVSAARTVRGDWSPLVSAAPELEGFQFSAEPMGFIGNSLGGMIGTMFVAVEGEIDAAVLAVTGGSVLTLVVNSPSFNPSYLPQLYPLLGLDTADIDYDVLNPVFDPEMGLWQTLFDRGDSLLYGPRVARGEQHVLMLMSRDDETMPNLSTESLARAVGVTMIGGEPAYVDVPVGEAPLRGNVERGEGAVTRGMAVHAPADHGLLLYHRDRQDYAHPVEPPFEPLAEPVTFDNPIRDAQGQVLRFFESWRTGGTPEIQ